MIQWKLCNKHDIEIKEKWYDYKAKKVIETDEVKILWDFLIQMDKDSENSKSDIVLLHKVMGKCNFYPFDTRVSQK